MKARRLRSANVEVGMMDSQLKKTLKHREGRVCPWKGCGQVISLYNLDSENHLCFVHQRAFAGLSILEQRQRRKIWMKKGLLRVRKNQHHQHHH